MWYVRYCIIWTIDFSQKLFSGDYFSVYAYDENNVVVFIHPATESIDTLDDGMPYEEAVDTIVDDIIEAMEWKTFKICDESDSRCVYEHEMGYGTQSLYDSLEEYTRDKLLICLSETKNG